MNEIEYKKVQMNKAKNIESRTGMAKITHNLFAIGGRQSRPMSN